MIELGHTCFTKDPVSGQLRYDPEKAARIGLRPVEEQVKPTQVNFGYVREIMDRIEALSLEPRRARFSILKANRQSALHRDAPDDAYAVRLHIPVITNDTCTFE